MKLIPILLLSLVLSACDSADMTTDTAITAIEPGALIIDVRSEEEVASGMLPNAIHIPHGDILTGTKSLNLSPDQSIVLYCRSGNRSGIALETLKSAGFTHALNGGGYATLSARLQTE